ncbi:MAG TPA: hypothetical protein VMU10_07080, partial [Desulfomonilia bacterium]|nr:hypothetical protein [Desulfomonilia bacterium]
IWPKLKIGDTQLITKLEMWDQNPWAAYPVNGFSDSPTDSGAAASKKNNISIERAYIHHNFDPDIFLEAGLMDGNWWGTSFMDTQLPRYRIKLQDNKTPFGVLGVLLEKDTEMGLTTDTKGQTSFDQDDGDAYAIYGVTKVGDVYIRPLIFWVLNSAFTPAPAATAATPAALVAAGLPATTDQFLSGIDQGHKGLYVWYYALAFDGKLGPLSFEAEAGLKDYRSRLAATFYAPGTFKLGATPLFATNYSNTWNEYGLYLNLWKDMDFGRAGAIAAYGSYDSKGGPTKAGWGNDFGDDFKSNLILGDEKGFGSTAALDLYGMTLIKPYLKYVKLADKLTCSGSIAYINSNQTGKNEVGAHSKFEGVTAYELDLGVQYKLSSNLLYKVDGGYASISVDKKYWGSKDPDPVMLLRHEILLTF